MSRTILLASLLMLPLAGHAQTADPVIPDDGAILTPAPAERTAPPEATVAPEGTLAPDAASDAPDDPTAPPPELDLAQSPDPAQAGPDTAAPDPDVADLTAPPAQADTPIPQDLAAELQRVKAEFLGLYTRVENLLQRNAALETRLLELQAKIYALDGGRLDALGARLDTLETRDPDTEALTDLAARITALETAQPKAPDPALTARLDTVETALGDLAAQPNGASDRIAALDSRLAALEAQLAAAIARIGKDPASPPPAGPEPSGPPPAAKQDFEAVVNANRTLRSFYANRLSPTEKLQLISPDRCAEAGAWFETAFSKRDFNAFFVQGKSPANPGVCALSKDGWRLRNGIRGERAHLVMEAK